MVPVILKPLLRTSDTGMHHSSGSSFFPTPARCLVAVSGALWPDAEHKGIVLICVVHSGNGRHALLTVQKGSIEVSETTPA